MRLFSRFSVAALSLALFVGSASTFADDAPATGSISGKVVDAKGDPAAKVTVSVKVAKTKGAAPTTQPAVKPLTAVTGDDGSFSFDKVPVGTYTVGAKDTAGGKGKSKGTVDVSDGKAADAGTITLK